MNSRATPSTSSGSLDDRPPDVHVRPAGQRPPCDAARRSGDRGEAQDDFGVAAARTGVRGPRGGGKGGAARHTAAFDVGHGRHYVMYLEDIDVTPGDFVSYYVRARDVHARQAAERSAQRHLLPRGQAVRGGVRAGAEPGAMGGGGGNRQLDDLVAAQKEIVVATWKLDRALARRAGREVRAGHRAVAESEEELKHARRADVELLPSSRRCGIRAARVRQSAAGAVRSRRARRSRRPAHRRSDRACPKKTR